jgi:threonine dehydratase
MITPQQTYPKLANTLKIQNLYFKREDLHPYGSHKGRSLPIIIDHYISQGHTGFTISSSGNAALAAGLYISELNRQGVGPLTLEIFIGLHISPEKEDMLRKKLTDPNILITKTERPLQSYLQKAGQDGKIWQGLRQSTDDTALAGYQSLASELMKIDKLEAVFIAASSATCAQALAEFFSKSKQRPQIHIVQTSSCNPISKEFDSPMNTEEISLADAIVDKTAARKDKIIHLIRQSKGSGWTISNEEIKKVQTILKEFTDLKVSSNGALSLAGLMKAQTNGWKWKGPVICIITGQ